jgi:hypothetical protein
MIKSKTQKGKVVKSTRYNRPGVPGSFTELLNLTRFDTCPLAIFTWILQFNPMKIICDQWRICDRRGSTDRREWLVGDAVTGVVVVFNGGSRS